MVSSWVPRLARSASVTVGVSVLATDTDESFKARVCSQLGPTSTELSITNPWFSNLRLPDCVFNHAPLTSLNAPNFFISAQDDEGRLTDPLERFSSSFASLNLVGCILDVQLRLGVASDRWPRGLYAPDWTSFFNAHPVLTSLTLSQANVGGPLPETLPSGLTTFAVTDAGLNGTIPSGLFSNVSSSIAKLTFQAARNDISGTIPSALFKTLAIPSVTLLHIDFSDNKLSGTLPTNFFESADLSSVSSALLLFTKNALEGTISPSLLGTGWSSLASLAFFLTDNRLSGTIPPSLLSFWTYAPKTSLSLALDGNQLFGDFPLSSLLSFSAGGYPQNAVVEVSRNNLNGTVPNLVVPSTAILPTTGLLSITVQATSNKLSGTLQSSMLAIPTTSAFTLRLFFDYNKITGTFPANWLAGLGANWVSVQLYFGKNQLEGSPFEGAIASPPGSFPNQLVMSYGSNKLSGTIPPNFCADCRGSHVNLDLSNNQINGTLPSTLLDAVSVRSHIVSLNFGSNQISSFSTPPDFLSALNTTTTLYVVTLNLDNNGMVGNLDFDLFAGVDLKSDLSPSFSLSLASNQFTGTLSSAFLASIPSYLSFFELRLDHNPLEGSLFSSFFAPIYSVKRYSVQVSLVNCSLTGAVDGTGLTGPVDTALRLFIDHNSFTGTFPLSVMMSQVNATRPLTISASHNKFDGLLSFEEVSNAPTLYFNLSSNLISSWSVHPSAASYVKHLDLSNNVKLEGSIQNNLFSLASSMTLFAASNTSLTGNAPIFTAGTTPFLTGFYLNNTKLDFCTSATGFSPPSIKGRCSIHNTSAVNCPRSYHYSCLESKNANPDPSCPIATRPSDQFICVGGIWVTNTTVTAPTLVIPGGATETIVNANLSTSVIVFNGLNSTLVINGCINNLTRVQVVLTTADLERLGSSGLTKILLQYSNGNGTCSNDLSSVVVSALSPDSSCKKVKTKTVTSNGTLSGIFTIDSSKCNTWWIILISVIAAVVVIAIVLVVLLVIFVPSVRLKLRPFSKKRSEDPTLS